jgi:hypothetical protein
MWQEWDVRGNDKRLLFTAIVRTSLGIIKIRRPERRWWTIGEDMKSTLRCES